MKQKLSIVCFATFIHNLSQIELVFTTKKKKKHFAVRPKSNASMDSRNGLDDDCTVAESTTISPDRSVIELDTSRTDDDCIIREPNISIISLDTSTNDADEANDCQLQVIHSIDDSYIDDDQSPPPKVESPDNDRHTESPADDAHQKCLFRMEFPDARTFDELASMLSAKIRDALFAIEKSVVVKINHIEQRIEFLEQEKNDVFTIDTLPTEKKVNTEIPNYDKISETLLDLEAKIIGGANDKAMRNGCWNCGGEHNLRDCKQPRNMKNIQRAKQMFGKTRADRYHVDAEQKYAQFTAGQISDNLRQALGLRRKELPLYIYKMRLYGYPPGWLEEAKVETSGLSLFISDVGRMAIASAMRILISSNVFPCRVPHCRAAQTKREKWAK